MPDPNATKQLSEVIGKELFLKLNKCSIKFMKTGETFSSQFSNYKLCTLKSIKENGCNKETQIHLRININQNGEDKGLFDVDFYVDKEDFDKQISEYLKEEMGNENKNIL